MHWRAFDILEPTDSIEEWETPNGAGYSEHWVTRLVFERGNYRPDEPIVEFYDINSFGQFVSAYYVSTTLKGWGYGLDLDGGIYSWTIDGPNMDAIRAWIEQECQANGYQF